jgi:hypothetical protein
MLVLLPRSPLIPDVDTSEGFGLWEGCELQFHFDKEFSSVNSVIYDIYGNLSPRTGS